MATSCQQTAWITQSVSSAGDGADEASRNNGQGRRGADGREVRGGREGGREGREGRDGDKGNDGEKRQTVGGRNKVSRDEGYFIGLFFYTINLTRISTNVSVEFASSSSRCSYIVPTGKRSFLRTEVCLWSMNLPSCCRPSWPICSGSIGPGQLHAVVHYQRWSTAPAPSPAR